MAMHARMKLRICTLPIRQLNATRPLRFSHHKEKSRGRQPERLTPESETSSAAESIASFGSLEMTDESAGWRIASLGRLPEDHAA
jgi:hypothetical protein